MTVHVEVLHIYYSCIIFIYKYSIWTGFVTQQTYKVSCVVNAISVEIIKVQGHRLNVLSGYLTNFKNDYKELKYSRWIVEYCRVGARQSNAVISAAAGADGQRRHHSASVYGQRVQHQQPEQWLVCSARQKAQEEGMGKLLKPKNKNDLR